VNERLFYTALQAGLAYFTSDADRFELFLIQEHGLTAAEAARMRTYFEYNPVEGEPGGPPNIIHGYPRTSGPFPCWAIILQADRNRQRMLGNDAGLFDDLDSDTDLDGNVAVPNVQIVDNQIQVWTCVPDLPDVGVVYYHLLRHIMFDNLEAMQKAPYYLQNIEFSGADINPMQQNLPENMWLRVLNVSFMTEEAGWETAGAVASIDGAYVDDGETVSGIKKQVTPY
jgi:hypothetical protein